MHERFAELGTDSADQAGIPADARFSFGDVPGFTKVSDLRAGQPDSLPEERTAGTTMHYTSGTTGRPKGVRRALTGLDPDDAMALVAAGLLAFFGVTEGQPNAHLLTLAELPHGRHRLRRRRAAHGSHAGLHGRVRRRDRAGSHRAVQVHELAHGADAVQADAVAAG